MKTKKYFIFTLFIVGLLFSCSKSVPIDEVKNRIWAGNVFRLEDNKELADALVRLSKDTMYVYSDAVFGSENDTLIFREYQEKDSIYIYQNSEEDLIRFQYKTEKQGINKYLTLISDDFYLVLMEFDYKMSDIDVYNIYNNRAVPRNPYMYFDGAYEGTLEAENQVVNLSLFSMGGITVKMVFMEDNIVRIYTKNLLMDMFSGGEKNYKTFPYEIIDDKIYLETDEGLFESPILVKNSGYTLVMESEEGNIILNKIY